MLSLIGSALPVGCDTVGYHFQSVSGHLPLMVQRGSIGQTTDNARRVHNNKLIKRLEDARSIRIYALRELDLSDNDSYRVYAGLKCPFVVWSVLAMPELPVRLKE